MRALLLAAAIFAACVSATSPWQIIEAWTKQMPGGRALDISPAYSAIPGMYFTTSYNGTIYGLNITSKTIQWSANYDDLVFIEALPGLNGLVLGRSGSTTLVQATTGEVLWTNQSIIIQADLTNHGDRNFIMFGTTMVYREQALGYTRVCTLDILEGARIWCDTLRNVGLPDAAPDNTFTAPLFDVNGQQYAANFDVRTGNYNWIIPVDTVLTGNLNYVAVANGTYIIALNSTNGSPISYVDVGVRFRGTSVMVHNNILSVCDGTNYVAAINMNSGEKMWNISTYFKGTMQLQRRGDGVLVLAVLGGKSTNFTRFGAYEGNFMWTVVARPTGWSLTPVHAWLGNDIIYVRDVTNTWSAYGVDSGELISTGSGDLFLPRSVAPNYLEPHVGYFVTGPEGIVYDLKIVPRK